MTTPNYDVIIVGAGFSGIRGLWEAKRLGLNAKCLEAGSDVGGVWYWNRYPGARTDSEGWVYSMNFAPNMKDLWDYQERYPSQKDVQSYLRRVAEKYDLLKQVQFNTRVKSAHFSDSDTLWTITTEDGVKLSSRYFISATGPLSIAKKLPFPGLKNFKGEWLRSFDWPEKSPNFEGKRVAIIGTGATGVQIIPKIAPFCKELVVFQRSANYVLPGRNYLIDEGIKHQIREDYDKTWNQALNHWGGLPMVSTGKLLKNTTDEKEIRQVLDKAWEAGGFHVQFESFDDVFTDAKANETVSSYLRDKIRAVVQDPATAELLCPTHPFLAKRPPCGHSYYETFNRPNVKLVDIRNDELDISEKGVKTLKAGKEYEVDVIIFALGFDAGTGALTEIDVRGKDGKSLKEIWDKRVETFVGTMVPGFPNMFTICGPHIPFGNMPVILEVNAAWIGKTIEFMKKKKYNKVEAKAEAAEDFLKDLNTTYNATFFAKAAEKSRAWFVGANIPGKVAGPIFYFGGADKWVDWLNKEEKESWSSMTFGSEVAVK